MIPSTLDHLITTLLDAMRDHPQHALLPFQRHAVYEQLGSIKGSGGYQRCGWLAVLTTQHVCPLWQRIRPRDERVDQLLMLAKGVLQAEVDPQVATEAADESWYWFINDEGNNAYLKELKESPTALFVFGATIGTLLLSVGKDIVQSGLIDEDATDADIDPWSTDVAGWAIAAYAGPVWDPGSDSAKRLEFWTWWLTEAVPAAWKQEISLDLP